MKIFKAQKRSCLLVPTFACGYWFEKKITRVAPRRANIERFLSDFSLLYPYLLQNVHHLPTLQLQCFVSIFIRFFASLRDGRYHNEMNIRYGFRLHWITLLGSCVSERKLATKPILLFVRISKVYKKHF